MKIGLDKYTHFFVGISIAAFASLPFGLIVVVLFVFLFAIGRELYNKYIQKKVFSIEDILATVLGGFVWIIYSGLYNHFNLVQ